MGGWLRLSVVVSFAVSCATPPPPKPPEEPRLASECFDRPVAMMGISGSGQRLREQADAAYRRGVDAADAGDHAKAIAAFGEALEADSAHADAHFAKAKSHLFFDSDLAAISYHLANTLVLEPERAESHALFGQALAERGDAAGAATHYRCALSLDAELEAARVELAAQLVSSGDHDAAEEELARVLQNGRDVDFRIRSLMASALAGQGKFRDAARELERAAAQTKSAVLFRRAADLFAQAGDDTEADALRTRADRIDPPPKRRKMRPLVKAKPPPKKRRRK